MFRKGLLVGFALPLLLTCVPVDHNTEYEVTTLVLPQGHPDAGREAFRTLGCASCHRVRWEENVPEPVSANPGPELGPALAHLTAGGVATSIIAPSHFVPLEIRARSEGDLSPMPDFAATMTVRQMIDLVAYLQSRGDRTMATAQVLNEVGTKPRL